jgi:hypothetical protein
MVSDMIDPSNRISNHCNARAIPKSIKAVVSMS